MIFDSPYFLLALVPIAGAIVQLVWWRKKKCQPALHFSSQRLVRELPKTVWQSLFWLPDALRFLALVCFAIALARPQMLGAAENDDSDGIDIVLAFDISASMRAADFQPNDRLHVAKKSISELIKQRTNDRIGLVVFSGEAATWAPLTLDYSLLAQLLEEVEIGMLPDGTAIGSAIATGVNRLRESDAKSRVIVLLTDGDNNSGNITPKKAAELAKELGIRIYTILIGRGGEVPYPAGRDLFGRITYRNTVIPTNPALMKELASMTGGDAYDASDKEELDASLSSVLDSLEKTRLEAAGPVAPRTELFPYFVFAGLLFVALELLLSSTRLARYP
jgi:Ca-activated chloride channel family protein